jgi:putative aldouronate transport system permease protein
LPDGCDVLFSAIFSIKDTGMGVAVKKTMLELSLIKLNRYKYLYLMLIPGMIFYAMFKYAPMGGIVIAFKDFNPFRGLWGSKWVGWNNFRKVFSSPDFLVIFKNTMLISGQKILFGFPMPIILALLLNEMRLFRFKKIVQTTIYLPHFISWAVVGTIFLSIFSPTYGFIPQFLEIFTGERINFIASRKYFVPLLIVSDIWKTCGWGTILYLAALTSIDPALYEAATVDGAGRWQKIWHITLPGLKSIIVVQLIMRFGWIMDAGFEQILIMQNPVVLGVSDIFDTYVYRIGLAQGQYSVTAAVDVFKSVVGFIMIVTLDRICKALGEEGII